MKNTQDRSRIEVTRSNGYALAAGLGTFAIIAVLAVTLSGQPSLEGIRWRVTFGVIAALALTAYVVARRQRIILDHEGVARVGVRGRRVIRWADVDHYRYWAVKPGQSRYTLMNPLMDKPPPHRGLWQGTIVVHATGGRKLRVTNTWGETALVFDFIFKQVHASLRTRATLRFEPLFASPIGLASPAGELAWRDITSVSIENYHLVVRGIDSNVWFKETMQRVHNIVLLLEHLAEHGVAVRVDDHVLLPQPTTDVLVGTLHATSRSPEGPSD